MKKRLISLALIAAVVLLTFTGCGSGLKYAATVGGVKVTDGVYRYYMDYVLSHPEEFSLDSESLEGDIEDTVSVLVKKYVAINSLWADLGINMTYDLRNDASSETDERWDIFGKYYESVGITKQDLYKIVKSETYRTALTNYYYGEESKISPIKTSTLKAAFSKKYVGVKIIAASLTTVDALGGTVKLKGTALTRIRNYFNSMKSLANNGADIETLYTNYNNSHDLIGTEGLDTYVFTENNTQYGANFFSTVSKLKFNKATVIENDDTIYLVYRVDIASDEYEYFMLYKNDILVDLYKAKIDALIDKRCADYEFDGKSRTVRKIYKQLSQIRSEEHSETTAATTAKPTAAGTTAAQTTKK